MNDLTRRVCELVTNSNSTEEKLGGLLAMDMLVDVDCEENATKVTGMNFLLDF
jgi:hypothetical protein